MTERPIEPASRNLSCADKPWLARADWAAGKIKAASTAPIRFLLLWSFLALAMTAPAIHAIPTEWRKGNHLILVALLFPAVAFYLLGFSFVKWRSRRRFGDCFFELAQIPAPLGGTLEGMIQTGTPLKLEQGLHLKISCIRRTVSGSGKNRSVNENILWQDEKIFKSHADLPEPEPGHSGIPVHFNVPADQPECGFSKTWKGSETVFWRLEAKAKLHGPDFRAVFDVPVFKVAGANAATANEADPTAALQMPIEEFRRDEHSKIKVTDGPDGREFYFPAARNIGAALFTTLLMFIFAGIAIATHHFHAPMIFPIFIGLFGVLLLWITLTLWFKSSRVTIDPSGVRAVNRWLFFSRTRRFAAAEVARFALKAGMQSGSQVFQDIQLITRDDAGNFKVDGVESRQNDATPLRRFNLTSPNGVTIAGGIASAAEANWLAQEMTKALGRRS
jgi:hypothetical protein